MESVNFENNTSQLFTHNTFQKSLHRTAEIAAVNQKFDGIAVTTTTACAFSQPHRMEDDA